jgi:hypothetical protein
MKLMEEIYIPKTLQEIIVPNPADFIENMSSSIENTKNALFIGSISTFKNHAMKLYIKEFYSKKKCEDILTSLMPWYQNPVIRKMSWI